MERVTNIEKQKGFSLPGILVAAVIAALLGAAAISNLWPSVDKTKVTVVANYFKELHNLLATQTLSEFKDIETANLNGDSNPVDYLNDIINAGMISPFPRNIFEKPNDLVVELRKVVVDGNSRVFYIYYSTPNDVDFQLIQKGVERSGLDVVSTPTP